MSSDTYRHQGSRKHLVNSIRAKGIRDARVLEAMMMVPRHAFFGDTAFEQFAYEDKAFPIGNGQTISQPYTVAFQSQLLNAAPGMRVLEIGTGCGYQTAVLCAMGLKVFSIERLRPLHLATKERLQRLGYRATLAHGDGFNGMPQFAPFDRILVTCAAPVVPEMLIQQLDLGARMVVPVGAGDVQAMMSVDKRADGTVDQQAYGTFKFVPMLGQRAR
jgi:protein-L-isoaspartate(D-aspartate) O-methyltransferase